MSVLIRGAKNAFRNKIRSAAIVFILAVSIGLALSMLLANQAVKQRIEQLKMQMGTTVMITPAGSKDAQGGGEPLKDADAEKVKTVPHVVSVESAVSLMLQTAGANQGGNGPGPKIALAGPGGSAEPGETNLLSSIDPGTLGARFQARSNGSSTPPPDIKLPIRAGGISGSRNEQGKELNIIEGAKLGTGNVALIGKDLAAKNNLKVGSTFTAYNETFTVAGIFDAGTKFENDMLYMPLATAQRLGQISGEIATMSVQVDSIENLESTMTAIKTALGENKVDVSTPEQNAQQAIDGLQSVSRISIVGFVMAIISAGIVIFLTMLMIVRERRREIGVLKAIGGSNRSIVMQFMVEALVLVVAASVVGFGVALLSSNSMANALVSSNTDTSESSDASQGPRMGGPKGMAVKLGGGSETLKDAKDLVGTVTTTVGLGTLAYALLATIVIAVIGSAAPAWLIAKVRPAEVMRGE